MRSYSFFNPWSFLSQIAAFTILSSNVAQAQFSTTTTNGTITITRYTGNLNVVIIPSTINGLPVTSIGAYAFSTSNLTSVAIPNSVTSIGDGVFILCANLTEINVYQGNSAYSSVDGVLFNQNQTTLIEYPPGKIGSSYKIPNSVTNIGNNAFGFCSLTSVTIPSKVTNFGVAAFESCPNLTSVTIPNTVTSIGEGIFIGCPNLTAINVNKGNSVYSSVDGVLFNQNQTALIEYPAGKIGTSYTISNNVTSIGNYAFDDCSNLTSVTIPNSVTSIGVATFKTCSGLTSVMIPNSVTSIGAGAFRHCTHLNSVAIGNGVTSIGNDAFEFCGLTTVTIPDSVTTIGNDAFGSTNLANVTIGKRVTSIGSNAFKSNYSLTSVTIPNSVTSIGAGAFQICYNLTSVYFTGNAPTVGSGVFAPYNRVTVYYYLGTRGWGSTFAECPTVMLNPPAITKLPASAGGVFKANDNSTVSFSSNSKPTDQ